MIEKKIVKVLWVDAHSQDTMSEKELKELMQKEGSALAPYWAVGWLLAENKEVLVVASGILPEEEKFFLEETVYKRIIFIPRLQVKGIWELQEK